MVVGRMATPYDLVLLLDPQAPEEQRHQVLDAVESMIDGGGVLMGAYDWGSRRMTFEIDHRGEAEYHIFQFEGGKDLLERLNHNLKITDGVLRFRIIRLKPGAPPPPTPRPESRSDSRARDDGDAPVAPRAAADARR
jgi:small subunit ribosomal protein S6